ncbi:SDR family NAD(P)-dependent oxidoreductase [Actinokineospora globicatena]|uniref:SDR family NAD(P)-dependent oxidoreductase n=1 Tax=Actinokineospora globicatena TaxID=103729 RepID=UPI0020A5E479|nr:SDR family oxidoreductase [Actinokineospora globicatena]MCP2303517.1 NAD(P)-dependent dehydrogenase, short-chain alcohol dehydrogenase family [Actinokineospora globicatena]GLW79346.1 ketoreductase [Actinokineospora globicatena]GLW86244.1 ketoreductase [Actinokineospora globicatena]
MRNKVVLITGAGTGIGKSTAQMFLALGAQVVIVGRRAHVLDSVTGAHALPADITADGEPQRIVDAVVEMHGRLDVLVNNAGIVQGGALGDIQPGSVDAQFATNVTAPILLTQAAAPVMVDGGVIVNVSTAIGQRAWPNNSVYAATKAALDSLTRSWAAELAPRGIRVMAVVPGAVETPIGEHQGLSPTQLREVRAWQIAHTPLGRIATPDEVAWVIVQLSSATASFITGVILPVDGGAVI